MTELAQQILIQLRDVDKAYATGEGPFFVLHDVNMDISRGQFLGITGKSGTAKTTLLNMISGINKLTSAEILFHGPADGDGESRERSISIHALSKDRLARWRGENIGVMRAVGVVDFEVIKSVVI